MCVVLRCDNFLYWMEDVWVVVDYHVGFFCDCLVQNGFAEVKRQKYLRDILLWKSYLKARIVP